MIKRLIEKGNSQFPTQSSAIWKRAWPLLRSTLADMRQCFIDLVDQD